MPAARLTDMHTCPMVTVVVLHVGSANVLCKLAGTPYKDFDPREFPENRNVWLKPEDFVENTER